MAITESCDYCGKPMKASGLRFNLVVVTTNGRDQSLVFDTHRCLRLKINKLGLLY
jgi:hypothetical protein